MENLINQEAAPVNQPQGKPGIVISQNPKKQSIVVDINGNILSSKNPHEAKIIGTQNFND